MKKGMQFPSKANILMMSCLLSACAELPFRPERLPEAVVVPLPLTVGLYQDEAVSDYEYRVDLIETWRPGVPIVAALEDAIRASFSEVQILDRLPVDDEISGTLDLVAYTKISHFRPIRPSAALIRSVSLGVEVTFETPEGEYIDTVTIRTRTFRDRTVGLALRRAIRSAVAEFIVRLRDSPALRTWLVEEGAYASALSGFSPVTMSSGAMLQGSATGTVAILASARRHELCLIDQLVEHVDAIPIMRDAGFRDAFFPWFDTTRDFDAQRTDALMRRLAQLSGAPAIQELVTGYDLSHLILINETDATGESWGGCSALIARSDGIGMCLGMRYFGSSSGLRAAVIRLGPPDTRQVIDHVVSGDLVWPRDMLSLVPTVPDSDIQACRGLAGAIGTRVLGTAPSR